MRIVFIVAVCLTCIGCASSIDRIATQANLDNIQTMKAELDEFYSNEDRYLSYELQTGRVHPSLRAKNLRNEKAMELARKMFNELAEEGTQNERTEEAVTGN